MMVKVEEFAKAVGYAEKLRLARAYFPQEFTGKNGYALTNAGILGLTGKQKRRLSKVYNQIRPFVGPTSKKIYTYNEERASAAWRSLFGVEPPGGTLYIPVVGNEPRLEYWSAGPDDLRARIRDNNVEESRHFFADYGISKEELMRDTERVLKGLHEIIGGARYAIMTGNHVLRRSSGSMLIGTIEDVISQFVKRMNGYAPEKQQYMYEDVLLGLVSYNFDSLSDFSAYQNEELAKRKARDAVKKELTDINESISGAQERLKSNRDSLRDYKHELQFLLSGVRGKERARFVKSSKVVKNLNSKIKRLESSATRTKNTLAKALKRQSVLVKELTSK